MGTVHIHSPPYKLARKIRRCTTCKRRRRFLVKVYEYYAAESICGGCGHEFVSGEGRTWSSQRCRSSRRAFVRESWAKAKRFDEAIRDLLKGTQNDPATQATLADVGEG